MAVGSPALLWPALLTSSAPHAGLVGALGGGAGALVQHSPLGFVVAFGAGVVSFLSPCVLPLVPSYLSMMSGVGLSAGSGGEAARRARLVWSTVLFVAGFSVVFAFLEATASAVSEPLRAHKPVLDDVAGALIIAMGLVIAGAPRLAWLQRERRFAIRPSALGPWAAPLMGMTFAFGWTPCITPVLAAVLGLASSGGTLARGEEMLVAYSLGLGVPFVVTGLAFGRLSGAFSFARRHSRAMNVGSGMVLAALGVVLITGEVGVLSSWSDSVLQHVGLGSLATS
jgi:cytochrome c-type biogenesis protein